MYGIYENVKFPKEVEVKSEEILNLITSFSPVRQPIEEIKPNPVQPWERDEYLSWIRQWLAGEESMLLPELMFEIDECCNMLSHTEICQILEQVLNYPGSAEDWTVFALLAEIICEKRQAMLSPPEWNVLLQIKDKAMDLRDTFLSHERKVRTYLRALCRYFKPMVTGLYDKELCFLWLTFFLMKER